MWVYFTIILFLAVMAALLALTSIMIRWRDDDENED